MTQKGLVSLNKYRFTFTFTRTQDGDPPVGDRRMEFEAENDSVAEDVASSWGDIFGSETTGGCNTKLERLDYTTVWTHTY